MKALPSLERISTGRPRSTARSLSVPFGAAARWRPLGSNLANNTSAPELLAIVEVPRDERVRCQAAGCNHPVFRRLIQQFETEYQAEVARKAALAATVASAATTQDRPQPSQQHVERRSHQIHHGALNACGEAFTAHPSKIAPETPT
jgi:hypothetical protein